MASLNSEISIILSDGAGLLLKPVGLELVYTYNEIPYAVVDLDPTAIGLLCNFDDKYRRKKVTINVQSTYGCIDFEGLMDGLSIQQNFGVIKLMLVVKSTFQVLLETYPRMPGLHPSSESIFKRTDLLKFKQSSEGALNSINIANLIKPDPEMNAIRYTLECAKACVKSQQNANLFSNFNRDLSSIIALAQTFALTTLPLALSKLESIDVSPCDGFKVSVVNNVINTWILSALINSHDSIFNSLRQALNDLGCALVIGADKGWIVPDVGFLSMQHRSKIGIGELSNEINELYPAQYDSVSFNDNGYRDIKACVVVSDERIQQLKAPFLADLGKYIDPNERSTGGVLTLTLPKYVALGASSLPPHLTSKAQAGVTANDDNLKGKIQPDTTKTAINETETEVRAAAIEEQREFVDNWAQLQYLRAKYQDRVGNFSTTFDPYWAPAAVGTIYTRHPSTYIDFYVTRITHRFQIGPPNQGSAVTLVNFSCGRMGSAGTGSGIDNVILYDYDAAKSQDYAKKFVNNILGND